MTNPNDPADMPTMADQVSIKMDCWCKRLTKREHFAAQFMAALLPTEHWINGEYLGELSCRFADDLIVALNKPQETK